MPPLSSCLRKKTTITERLILTMFTHASSLVFTTGIRALGMWGKKVEWERANKEKNIIYTNVHPAIVTSVSKKHQFNNINPHESHIDS